MKTKNTVILTVSLLLLIMCMNLCRNFLWLVPSSLMAPIMEEMALNYTQAGQLLMIVTAFMGVFLFCGSYLLGKIPPIAAMLIGLSALAIDGACSFLAGSFPVMLIGRVFAGIGYGLTTCATSALIASWFEKDRLGIANGLNNCMSSLSTTVTYAGIVPIYNLLNQSWRKETLLWAVCSIVTAILFAVWFLFGQKSLKRADVKKKGMNNVRTALSLPVVQRFTGIMSCVMLVYVCLNSYYPNYLNQELGLSLEKASNITSVMPLSGMFGSMITGSVLPIFKNRKALLTGLFLMVFVGFLGAMLLHGPLLLTISVCFIGFGFSSLSTLGATSIMCQNGISPMVAGAGASMMCAFGSLLGIIVPSIQQVLAQWFNLRWSLMCFGVLLLPALFLILTMPKACLSCEPDTK